MASLDYTIEDKDTNDKYDNMIIDISTLDDYDFKCVWNGIIHDIKKHYSLFKEKFDDIKKYMKELKDDDEELYKEEIKFCDLQKQKSKTIILMGNAVISKNRQAATTYLNQLKNICDLILEQAELIINKIGYNENNYIEVCKEMNKVYNYNRVFVRVLINEYYRLAI